MMVSCISSVLSRWKTVLWCAPLALALLGIKDTGRMLHEFPFFPQQETLTTTASSAATADDTTIEELGRLVPCTVTHIEGEEETLSQLQGEDLWRRQVKFFMIGAQKAGSTSIYHYLTQHPHVIHNRKKETRCFHLNWNRTDPFCRHWYFGKILMSDPNLVAGDFSPGYLFMSHSVIPRAKKAFPWAKIMAVLRDPIERAFSEHNMNLRYGINNRTFTDRVMDELELLRKTRLTPHWKFKKEHNDDMTLQDWLQADVDMDMFRKFSGSMGERLLMNYYTDELRKTLVTQGMYAVHLRHWMSEFPCDRFLVLKSEDLKDTAGIEAAITKIHEHVGLPHVPLESPEAKNAHDKVTVMDPDIRKLLERFYRPYNDQLQELLGDEWKETW